MPHRCTECGGEFVDGDMQILKGCECGNNKFLYVPKEKEEKEVDVEEKAEEVKSQIAEEMGLELETVRIVAPGQYEINLDKVLSRQEIIISLQQNGKYLLHLPSLLKSKKMDKTKDTKTKKKKE